MTQKNDTVHFPEIIRQIREDDKYKLDVVVPMKELVMLKDGKLIRNGYVGQEEGIGFTDHALTQAFNRLGIPVRYGKRLMEERPDLVADQFNHWTGTDERGTLLRIRAGENGQGKIRGFLSDHYTTLDNKDVMVALEEVLKGIDGADIRTFFLDDRRSHIRLTLPALSTSYGLTLDGKADILQVGVDIVNSEVGASSLIISPVVYRLVCTNGLRAWRTDGDVFYQRHVHLTSQELYAKMSEAIAFAIKAGDELLTKMLTAKEFKVPKPLDVIERLCKKQMYSKEFTENTQKNFLLEPMYNLYGVVNAFTRTALELKNEHRLEIEEYAGSLLTNTREMTNEA